MSSQKESESEIAPSATQHSDSSDSNYVLSNLDFQGNDGQNGENSEQSNSDESGSDDESDSSEYQCTLPQQPVRSYNLRSGNQLSFVFLFPIIDAMNPVVLQKQREQFRFRFGNESNRQ